MINDNELLDTMIMQLENVSRNYARGLFNANEMDEYVQEIIADYYIKKLGDINYGKE